MLRGIVLPRFLRRPARMVEKLDWRLPRHLGLKGVVVLFLATAVAGILLGGHGLTVVSALTAWSGLAVDQVRITGQSETSEVDVLDRLAIGDLASLLTFDVDAARARVEGLPWVKQATLKKLYPDTLEVAVSERVPFAVWQSGTELWLVDETGKVITGAIGERYAHLPLVVGPGAAERAREFTNLIGAFPQVAEKTRAGALVSGRRWTVILKNGIALMLPELDPAAALEKIVRLDADDPLLTREIAAVDLRTDGRLVVRLTEAGLAARKAMLKERALAAKRRGSST
ncbi:MAG: cell division protein FtsQ/DivIB [Bauldia sp.]